MTRSWDMGVAERGLTDTVTHTEFSVSVTDRAHCAVSKAVKQLPPGETIAPDRSLARKKDRRSWPTHTRILLPPTIRALAPRFELRLRAN